MKRQRFVIIDRLRNLGAAEAMCLVLCGLVLTESAEAASDGAFKTSSGNIVCGMSNTEVICVIKSGLNPAPPKTVAATGRATRSQSGHPAGRRRCRADPLCRRSRTAGGRGGRESSRLWLDDDKGRDRLRRVRIRPGLHQQQRPRLLSQPCVGAVFLGLKSM